MNIQSDENLILAKVIEQTLARFALMFGEPAEKKDAEKYAGECVLARIKFGNFISGTVNIAVPLEFCLVLAASAMGFSVDDKITDENKFDAIKEFINVAAGHYVTELFGADKRIDLMPPEVAALDYTSWKNEVKESQLVLMVDDLPITIRVSKADKK